MPSFESSIGQTRPFGSGKRGDTVLSPDSTLGVLGTYLSSHDANSWPITQNIGSDYGAINRFTQGHKDFL